MEYGFKLDDYALIYKINYNVMSFFFFFFEKQMLWVEITSHTLFFNILIMSRMAYRDEKKKKNEKHIKERTSI